MIKYLELTAPSESAFRQAKILSIECNEGDQVHIGSTLFTVKSGKQKIDLPSTMDGRVVELIATVGENITLSSALLLLETEVATSTASKPITELNNTAAQKDQTEAQTKNRESKKAPQAKASKTSKETGNKKRSKKASIKKHEQQMLDLYGDKSPEATQEDNAVTNQTVPGDAKQNPHLPQNTLGTNATSETMSADSTIQITVPDIGADSAKVIEILVSVGDTVAAEDPLITLESDKASMDVPSPNDGVVSAITVLLDQDVSEGTLIVELAPSEGATTKQSEPDETATASDTASTAKEPISAKEHQVANAETDKTQAKPPTPPVSIDSNGSSHASPSIRRLARELGVDLSKVSGSGRKGRITKDDLKGFVKSVISTGTASTAAITPATGSGIPPIPAQDFSKFGEIELQPLHRIKRLTATNLHRSWVNVPHVTHNDESNISDLEAFRKQLNSEYAKQNKNIKLSPLAFIVKALVNAMQLYPQFNSSLDPGGENLIYKKYFNIGIAVDTPNGLVVPVIKNADQKSVTEIAIEMGELAAKARDNKLKMTDMSGACITISSLGGIGGTSFTPIVNAPEVAILGVSRGKMQPVWNGSDFEPGLILPLSLSYDHRVIDGAEAARFTRRIAAVLEDVRRLVV